MTLLLIIKNFYIASDTGLYFFSQKNSKIYTKSDGLLSNHISSIYKDNYNVLWIGTLKGLNVYTK